MNRVKTVGIIILMMIFAGHIHAQEEADRIYVNAVEWSHDGSKIAVVGIRYPLIQGYLRVLDAQTGETLYALDPTPGGFTSVAWSPDDRFIVAGGYDQVIWVFDVDAGTHVTTLWGHQSTVTAVDWSADGTRLVSGGNWDRLIFLWDTTDYELIRSIQTGDVWDTEFSPDGQSIAVGGTAGLNIFPSSLDVGSYREQKPYRFFNHLNVGALAWSPDGSRIAFGTQVFQSVIDPERKVFSRLYIVDSRTGTELKSFLTEDDAIYGLDWSPDGRLIATYSADGSVRVWDVETATALERYPAATRYPVDISFSPYGGRLAYGLTIDPAQQMRGAGLAASGVAIVVPEASQARLQAVAAQCRLAGAAADTVNALIADGELDALAAAVETLDAEAIAPGCRADLLAVAAALKAAG